MRAIKFQNSSQIPHLWNTNGGHTADKRLNETTHKEIFRNVLKFHPYVIGIYNRVVYNIERKIEFFYYIYTITLSKALEFKNKAKLAFVKIPFSWNFMEHWNFNRIVEAII